MMCVSRNMVVYFRYVMRNNRDEIIENTMNGNSKCYLHGSLGIQPSLQSQFEGLKAGDTKRIYLMNSRLMDADFTFEVIIDEVRMAMEEELALGYPVSADHLLCDASCICYNSK